MKSFASPTPRRRRWASSRSGSRGRAAGRAVALPAWAWTLAQRVTWLPAMRAVAALVGARVYWRFSLLIDNVFWLDTSKLQVIWTVAPIELDAGLADLVATFVNVITRL